MSCLILNSLYLIDFVFDCMESNELTYIISFYCLLSYFWILVLVSLWYLNRGLQHSSLIFIFYYLIFIWMDVIIIPTALLIQWISVLLFYIIFYFILFFLLILLYYSGTLESITAQLWLRCLFYWGIRVIFAVLYLWILIFYVLFYFFILYFYFDCFSGISLLYLVVRLLRSIVMQL